MQSFEDTVNQYKQDLMKRERNRGARRAAGMDAVRPEEPPAPAPETVHPYINYGSPAESFPPAAADGFVGYVDETTMETLSPEDPPLVSYTEFMEINLNREPKCRRSQGSKPPRSAA
ncbi:MAG: hypothetical protein ACLSAP_03885 [Oscillospiraceae bacterium]